MIPWFSWRNPALGTFLGTPISIDVFGLVFVAAHAVGALCFLRKSHELGANRALSGRFFFYGVLAAITCAHLFDALFYHSAEVLARPLYLLEFSNGMASTGGFLGWVLAFAWASKRLPQEASKWREAATLALPLAYAVGRFGCFLVHDHPGIPTSFFLGVRDYEAGLPPFVTRHDLGLYECLASLLVFFIGTAIKDPFTRLRCGIAVYASLRLGMDFLRAYDIPEAEPRTAFLTPAQWICFAALLLLAVDLLRHRMLRFRNET